VPAINVERFEEVARRIKIVENHARLVHIDVADGSFTPFAVWHDARDLMGFKTPLLIEVHFMVNLPEEKISPWLSTPAQRIIFHAEATAKGRDLIAELKSAGKEAGVSIRPDSPWELLLAYAQSADLLQTLAVPPGPSGQQFDQRTLEKLKNLRSRFPEISLEVDGGVHVGIARECKNAGADLIVVGSSLFEPDGAFEEKLFALEHDLSS